MSTDGSFLSASIQEVLFMSVQIYGKWSGENLFYKDMVDNYFYSWSEKAELLKYPKVLTVQAAAIGWIILVHEGVFIIPLYCQIHSCCTIVSSTPKLRFFCAVSVESMVEECMPNMVRRIDSYTLNGNENSIDKSNYVPSIKIRLEEYFAGEVKWCWFYRIITANFVSLW